jgi:hypothetical protein
MNGLDEEYLPKNPNSFPPKVNPDEPQREANPYRTALPSYQSEVKLPKIVKLSNPCKLAALRKMI